MLDQEVSSLVFDRYRESHCIGYAIQAVIKSADISQPQVKALEEVEYKLTLDVEHNGLGLSPDQALDEAQLKNVKHLVEAWLQASAHPLPTTYACTQRPVGRRGMTLGEKILAHHSVYDYVQPGQVIFVNVDWVLSSEISWTGMKETLQEMGNPKIHRNDRLWLAADHIVDPRNYEVPKIKRFIEHAKQASDQLKLTNYQKPNYTILHTEFYRERAEPGALIIGADSHTCSSGAVGALAIGLGSTDVVLPLVTGQSWLQIPETINIVFKGEPQFCIGGKRYHSSCSCNFKTKHGS